jgi:hypothetical protein
LVNVQVAAQGKNGTPTAPTISIIPTNATPELKNLFDAATKLKAVFDQISSGAADMAQAHNILIEFEEALNAVQNFTPENLAAHLLVAAFKSLENPANRAADLQNLSQAFPLPTLLANFLGQFGLENILADLPVLGGAIAQSDAPGNQLLAFKALVREKRLSQKYANLMQKK